MRECGKEESLQLSDKWPKITEVNLGNRSIVDSCTVSLTVG